MSGKSDYRDTDAEKLGERVWEFVRQEWMNYPPNIDSPWPVPESEVADLPTLSSYLGNLGGPEKRDSTIEEDIPGLRVAALHESVILLHKAGNVLRAAADEGEGGYRTWSRSSAYHAAYFGMRGVLGLLGILIFRAADRRSDYQVDLWAPRLRKGKNGIADSRYAIRIIRRGRGAEHKEMWNIFSRILRITKIDPAIWPLIKEDPLRNLDVGRFSFVRHQIHYRSSGWLFKDVDNLDESDDFSGLAKDVASMGNLRNSEGGTFPVSLALHIFSMGIALLANLGEDMPKIKLECRRAEKWMAASPWKLANAFGLIGKGANS